MTVQYLSDCYAFVQMVAVYLGDDGALGSAIFGALWRVAMQNEGCCNLEGNLLKALF